MFSSRYFRCLVPAMGTTSSPCARTHARASCAAVHFLAAAIFSDSFDQRKIPLQIFTLESRSDRTEIIFAQVAWAAKFPGQESAPQRTVGHKSDSQLAARGKDLCLRIASPERIFRLQRGDGMHFGGAADRGGAASDNPRKRTLPCLNQFRHRAHGFFDGTLGIHAMLVVKIDGFDAEPAQACFAALLHVFGPPADSREIFRPGSEHSRISWPE